MTRRTPPPTRPITDAFPQLRPLARTAVRLHPRHSATTLPIDASKIGGAILWPTDDPWPTCDQPEHVMEYEGKRMVQTADGPRVGRSFRAAWAPVADPRHTGVFVPVLQLRRADVPELPFPDDTDLFQIVWCPRGHPEMYIPNLRVYWRRAAGIGAIRSDFPTPIPYIDELGNESDDMIPRHECIIQPERVAEYPAPWELIARNPVDRAAFDTFLDETEDHAVTGMAFPGIKVGGYAAWSQDPVEFTCPRGHVMDLLITFDSEEPPAAMILSPDEQAEYDSDQPGAHWAVAEPTGMIFGRAGCLYIFACLTCDDHPVAATVQ